MASKTFNTYTKRARSVAEYTMMRGVTDFSNASQFNLYEKGYLNDSDYYYYVESGVIKYEESSRFMERQV